MKKMETFNSASLGTRIDGGSFFEGTPIFPHALKGIIISPNARIGKNAKIFQQVTIGIADFDGDKKDVPIIGNNVTIGAGAKILGAISVGDNVKIGANSVITKDVPDNCTIVGFNNIIKTN
ncbi:MAG: serine acetyltransferase [Lachnospiraceae bacterium]|nr:serine acetyltransferase [Lachnospiraceae bacterium]